MLTLENAARACRRRRIYAASIPLMLLALDAFAQAPPPAPVRVTTALERPLTPSTLILGTTEPRRRSQVAAAIEGYVLEYPAREGARVKKGELLARLRDTTLRLRLGQKEAALEELRELHRQAVVELERAKRLFDKGAVTQKALDDAVTNERIQALRLPQAKGETDVLKRDIEKKKVTSPFDGQILREHTQVGEWLARGGLAATIVDITSVFVRANVPERYIRFVHMGAEVSVEVLAARNERYHGKIVSVADEGDGSARTFPVRVEISGDGYLRAGMSARVEFPTGPPRQALVVSKDAILQRAGRSFVFIVDPSGKADEREVETGSASGSTFEIVRGLRPGDRVVVEGNERLRPGLPLRILTDGASAQPAAAEEPTREGAKGASEAGAASD